MSTAAPQHFRIVPIQQFEDSRGNVDWLAFRAAQVAAGELCASCERYLRQGENFSTGPAGRRFPVVCNDCRAKPEAMPKGESE